MNSTETTRPPESSHAEPMLAERHRRELVEGSAIDQDVLAESGVRTVTSRELPALGFAHYQADLRGGSAILFPQLDTNGENGRYRIKPDVPRVGKDGKPRKYEHPAGTDLIINVAPRSLADLLNPDVSLHIAEGDKKMLALSGTGRCTISIPGVDGWYCNPEHGGYATIQPLSDWDRLIPTLDGRKVYLWFDSDSRTKTGVGRALRRLANFLARHGAWVFIVQLPDAPDGAKWGADDVLAARGPAMLDELERNADPATLGAVNVLKARIRELEQERSAIFEVLHNSNLSATERVVAVSVVCDAASKLSRGRPAPFRVTIDAPEDPKNPKDPNRVGLAQDFGLGKNTVSRAMEVVFTQDAPLKKDRVFDRNQAGQMISRIQMTPTATCSGGVPGMLRELARLDPARTTQPHGGVRPQTRKLVIPIQHDHEDEPLHVRVTGIECGEILFDETVAAPNHQVGDSVSTPSSTPSAFPPYVLRRTTNLVIRPPVEADAPALTLEVEAALPSRPEPTGQCPGCFESWTPRKGSASTVCGKCTFYAAQQASAAVPA